jgi:hypothetical protein
MAEVFRNFSVYAGSQKIGVMSGASYDRKSGKELQFGDGEVIGVSMGIKTVELKIKTITPYLGNNVLDYLEQAYNNDTQVKVNVGILNGKDHMLDLWVTDISDATETKNGVTTGDWTLIGPDGKQV